MNRYTLFLPALATVAMGIYACTPARPQPWTAIVKPDLVFAEQNGLVAVEAEHFFQQSNTEKRAWYITSTNNVPGITPDVDPAHLVQASNGAYVEALPDTRVTHDDLLITGENFSDEAGLVAVLHYHVHITTPGRFFVWVRCLSTGSEDNGIHVGLNGQWPASGQRWQTVQKQTWAWDCKQRTEAVHVGVPMQLYLDIPTAGDHVVTFAMREDGFEMDKFVLARDPQFRPDGHGPAVAVKSGQLPPPFPTVAPTQTAQPFPLQWGEPPAIQTRDLVPLPGGYGAGSSTLRAWIQQKLDQDHAAKGAAAAITAKEFIRGASGYYLDQEKWLAIDPATGKAATARAAFPFPSGKYDVTLQVVGESDGQSTFQLAVGETKIGDFTAPMSSETFEEGAKFSCTWKGIELLTDAPLTVSSQIASADGKEWSRARVVQVEFVAGDHATQMALAAFLALRAGSSPAATGEPLAQPRRPDGKATVTITGELKRWHKVTLDLDGPFAHELDQQPNAFTDHAFQVRFTHESGSPTYLVPGYFAADGNAGNSSADAGTIWRAHLSPDKVGTWTYAVSFTRGKHAALIGGGQPLAPFDGITGRFVITDSDKTGRDFRAQGRLQYVGKHYLQFTGSQQYFLKAGPDAPETLLAYTGFDNTAAGKPEKVPLKTFTSHVGDWKTGDPIWRDGQGKGLIGALNYLASKGLNAFSFLTYNVSGDGDNVWPFVARDAKLHYDCSKLDQWGMVFDHATQMGLYLHFKLQETEMDDERQGHTRKQSKIPAALDGGKLGTERKLYCREIVARFGHALVLNWNIGEENTQTSDEVRDMITYLHGVDPYRHHIVLHTYPNEQDQVYKPLLGDQSLLTGVSLQNMWNAVHQRTLLWVNASAAAGRPWVVANDEQGPANYGIPPDPGYRGHSGIAEEKKPDGLAAEGHEKSTAYTMHDVRKLTLWGNLMAGGAGVEYYFGYALPENDLVAEDFRSRDQSWGYCGIALEFFRTQQIPLADMKNLNPLVGNAKNDNSRYCLAKTGELYLVYLPNGGSSQLDLSGVSGAFAVTWFNPRVGGALVNGSVATVSGGGSVELGNPPADAAEDWLAIIRRSAP
jgi:Domain of unknown function (DUF5060)/Putative collagen-binding domain of a collagenase